MTTADYIVGIVDKDLQKTEIEEAIAWERRIVAEECAMMAYAKGDYSLACDILDRYIWKLRHEENGDVVREL